MPYYTFFAENANHALIVSTFTQFSVEIELNKRVLYKCFDFILQYSILCENELSNCVTVFDKIEKSAVKSE